LFLKATPVEIGSAAFTTTVNLLSRTLFSTDFASLDSDSSQEFKKLMEQVLELVGAPNVSDFFPVLAPLDVQGIRRKFDGLVKFLLEHFYDQIDRRTKERENGYTSQHDFLDVLLDSEFAEGGPEFRQPLISILNVINLSLCLYNLRLHRS
jgi:Cytochrome P450